MVDAMLLEQHMLLDLIFYGNDCDGLTFQMFWLCIHPVSKLSSMMQRLRQ